MISKEEVKKAIKVVFNSECHKCYFPKKRTCKACLDTNKKIIKKYIKQLEANNYEQNNIINSYIEEREKLIDKLEEKIKYFEECDELIASSNDNYSDGTVTYRFIKEFTEILSIAKGENKR